ncbi:hypothetical protein HID58_028865 [Brassica napus]|uniref:YGGT family protein n=1 Tax=Brassica napus TaxID=3708 RepID=A0ABQ8CBE5_BRANA|nr:hypothetical protein HID58_028865 [Brassica napus]
MAFFSITNILSLRSAFLINCNPPLRLSLPHKPTFNLSHKTRKSIVSAVASPYPTLSTGFPFSDSTKSITTLAILAGIVTKSLIRKLSAAVFQASFRISGPLFFASIRDRPAGYLNTPLTVVAAVLSKWLDIYSGVLMVRVLLSWFPNIPWDRQPLSAIRDLCDPYLNLFRNIIPLVFDTLMVALCLLLLFWSEARHSPMMEITTTGQPGGTAWLLSTNWVAK